METVSPDSFNELCNGLTHAFLVRRYWKGREGKGTCILRRGSIVEMACEQILEVLALAHAM